MKDLSLPLIIEIDSAVDESNKRKKWKLLRSVELSKNMKRFDFKCNEYRTKIMGNGVTYFGRHFIISFAGRFSPTRTYTTVLSLTQERNDLRSRLLRFFERRLAGAYDEFEIPTNYINEKDTLSIFVKRYPFPKGFSR
jgi:hypothetical protein